MAEAIYKVGDILEIEKMYGMLPSNVKTRCLVLKCIHPGYEFIIYSLLIYKSDESFTIMGLNQKELFRSARKVGHVDISSFLGDKESMEPDYAMFFTAATVAQAADLRYENEKLKAENKALSDTLSKSEAKAQSRLDRNEVLKRENEELREANEKLSAENERLSNAKRYLDLSNENRELKAMNDELRKSIPEYNKLILKYFGCTEKIKKLEDENARYLQSMTCSEKQMTEAAKRIHEAMEHLNVALCSN